MRSVFFFWFHLGNEDQADGADADKGIDNCGGFS